MGGKTESGQYEILTVRTRQIADSVAMILSNGKQKRPLLLLLSLVAVSLAALLVVSPIAQDQNYHAFADQRRLLGIPNFWNVASNLPFIAVGATGLLQFYRHPATIVLFLGIFLTGFGSSYYHLNPNDGTLFWDRLPMTLGFMAILTIVIAERVSPKGVILLWPLLAVGVFSLVVWHWTGDLRLYLWVQFFPFLALPLTFLLFTPRYTGTSYWLIGAALYALAKVLELYDHAIYSVGSIVSGHTLKHLAAAAACFVILNYFQRHRLIASDRPAPPNNCVVSTN